MPVRGSIGAASSQLLLADLREDLALVRVVLDALPVLLLVVDQARLVVVDRESLACLAVPEALLA